MATPGELTQRLHALSVEQLAVAPAQLVRDAALVTDLGLDSLGAIEWGMAIEDAFGLSLPEDAMQHVHTYGDVEELVHRLASAQA